MRTKSNIHKTQQGIVGSLEIRKTRQHYRCQRRSTSKYKKNPTKKHLLAVVIRYIYIYNTFSREFPLTGNTRTHKRPPLLDLPTEPDPPTHKGTDFLIYSKNTKH